MLLEKFQAYWDVISSLRSGKSFITLEGDGLDIAALVAAARYDVVPELSDDPAVKERVLAARQWLEDRIDGKGTSVYGVNTGVGDRGTNTRTGDLSSLQRSILVNVIVGIILPPSSSTKSLTHNPTFHDSTLLFPELWVKGAILVRLNTLLRGNSGVRWVIIERLHDLLAKNIVPCVPLRQSVSASGDLAPMGYIAASLQDEVEVKVWTGERGDRVQRAAATVASELYDSSVKFGPKEVIAMINGTAPSCAVATLALHDSIVLAHMSQILTAMTIEALMGTRESFDPFLSDVSRPHPGQVEVARNCRSILEDSKLAVIYDETDPVQQLRQDRYSLRTAPQWLGPQIEELLAGLKTLEIEMNSTTDNPIIDVKAGRDVHGGNFQGTSVAVVMEKTRVGLQHIGKLAYAQLSEMVNPKMSRGLPPDLCAFEPSLDFGIKSIDIATAAYMSELSFISNTVTNHVQSAELHNQSVNSLALVSARATYTAIQTLQMILSNQLFALCQALDIRAMTLIFFERMKTEIETSVDAILTTKWCNKRLVSLTNLLFNQARLNFTQTGHLDSEDRFLEVVRPLVADLVSSISSHAAAPVCLHRWHEDLAVKLRDRFRETRLEYFESGSAENLLGRTKHLYKYVRETLGVPMLKGGGFDTEAPDVQISKIYHGFDSGAIVPTILKVLGSD